MLERQFAFLMRQPDDAAFLVQLEPFLRALQGDPIIAAYLEDIREDLLKIVQVMEQADAELVPELIDLRNELVALRPSSDDSDAPPPGTHRTMERFEYEVTLAFFDEFVAREPPKFDEHSEGGTAGTLLNILRGKDTVHRLKLEPAGSSIVEIDPETGKPIPSTEAPTP